MDFTIVIIALSIGLTYVPALRGDAQDLLLYLWDKESQDELKFTLRNLTYQLGRDTPAYTILGAILGLIGESFTFVGLQNYLSILIECVMIIMVMIPKFSKMVTCAKDSSCQTP